jgi:flavodoxin I
MKVLLAFATYSSGTDLASQIVTTVLTEKNIAVERKDIREVSVDSLREYDYIIFASPSWRTRKGDGMPHEFFLDFIDKAEGTDFSGMRFGIFGLGDRAYTHFTGAVDELSSFVTSHGGSLIIEPLRIDGFYFNQAANEKYLEDWADQFSQHLIPSPSSIS